MISQSYEFPYHRLYYFVGMVLLVWAQEVAPFNTAPTLSGATTQLHMSTLQYRTLPSLFPRTTPPYLAVITELDGCDSDERLKETLDALFKATSSQHVDLVSVRITRTTDKAVRQRVLHLTQQLVMKSSKGKNFKVVVSSDWLETALDGGAHGIHFKETHRELILETKKLRTDLLIGTSAHSVGSALDACRLYQPDYFFVGTCYLTASHPEKTSTKDLEGPSLPGQVVSATEKMENRPVVFAIGGIDAKNCHEPVVKYGAHGVAVIRAVLAADDPSLAAKEINQNMSLY